MKMEKLVHVNLKTVDRRLLSSLPSILDEDDENDAVSQSWHNRTSLQEEMARMVREFQGREVYNNGRPLEASAFSQQNYNLMPGVHYVDFFFGKPAQRLKLAVSLNSDFTVFPCTSVSTVKNTSPEDCKCKRQLPLISLIHFSSHLFRTAQDLFVGIAIKFHLRNLGRKHGNELDVANARQGVRA